MEENGYYHLEYFQQRFSLFWLHWRLSTVRSPNVLFFIGLEMTKRFRLGDYIALIILRILMGIGEGTTFPALSVLLAVWVPARERSKLGSLVLGGGQVCAIFVTIFDVVFFSDYNVENLLICCVFSDWKCNSQLYIRVDFNALHMATCILFLGHHFHYLVYCFCNFFFLRIETSRNNTKLKLTGNNPCFLDSTMLQWSRFSSIHFTKGAWLSADWNRSTKAQRKFTADSMERYPY